MLLDKIQLEADEEILFQSRRHWFILAVQLFSLVVVLLAPLGGLLALQLLGAAEVFGNVVGYQALFMFGYSIWFLMIWVSIFSIWTNYYLDILTLTDRRVILIDQKGFFYRNVASFRLERMQDMHIEINGILATFLDFGTIHVETAGHGEQEFHIEGMPNPRTLKAAILNASDARLEQVGYEEQNNEGI